MSVSAEGKGTGDATERILREVARGGREFERVIFTRNRRVMASVGNGGRTLRLHIAFGSAGSGVLRALGGLLARRHGPHHARWRSEVRRFLEDAIPQVDEPSAPRRARSRDQDLPGDAVHLARLRAEFHRVNAAHFDCSLPEVPIRLSGRMRRRNGHFCSDPLEIVISRRLCIHGAEGEAEHTLRHEMIHLWQWVCGHRPGHGADFRQWARTLDVHPRATRAVRWRTVPLG